MITLRILLDLLDLSMGLLVVVAVGYLIMGAVGLVIGLGLSGLFVLGELFSRIRRMW